MKPKHFLFALSLAGLTACSTTTTTSGPGASEGDAESVMITYHIKAGQEVNFRGLLTRAWSTYRSERLVFPKPHILLQDREPSGKVRFIEIFTWVSHAAPQNAPDSVKQIWVREQSLCEARDGHTGIEGGEVYLMTP